MIVHNKIILASSSSSRYQILKKSGVNFQQTTPLCKEEDVKKKLSRKKYSPSAIAKHLSYEKSISVSRVKKYHNYNVVGCDTLIYLNNQIFDKAKNMHYLSVHKNFQKIYLNYFCFAKSLLTKLYQSTYDGS